MYYVSEDWKFNQIVRLFLKNELSVHPASINGDLLIIVKITIYLIDNETEAMFPEILKIFRAMTGKP